jgi:pimeloyl-ACP methyl ester carboxylesterase
VRRAVAVIVAALLSASATACRGDDGGGPPPATDLDLPAFSRAPAGLADARPGDVLRSERVELGLDGVTTWRVLYRSVGVNGGPAAVSGLVVAPVSPATPAEDLRRSTGTERPVLAYAHGTTGIADACAPSRRLVAGTGTLVDRIELSALAALAANGWVVTATDYEGLGTAGTHPFGVGDSAGRSVLDAVRAAERLSGTGAGPASATMIWGHSQGGGAALFAAELAPAHAPELRLVGAVAGAPAAELRALTDAILAGPNVGLAVMTAVGFAAAHPELDLRDLLTDDGLALAAQARTACVETIVAEAARQPAAHWFRGGVGVTPPFADLLERNSPGRRPTPVPVLIVHGQADQLIPVETSAALLRRLCAAGDVAHRIVYPGADHASVVISSTPDVMAWLQARLAGAPVQNDC